MAVDVQQLVEIIIDDLNRDERLGPMLRAVRQFIMDVDRHARHTGDPTPLLMDRPPSTGDERWDALIAGVVEDITLRHRVPAPSWVHDREPLAQWWFVSPHRSLHPIAFVETPPAIAQHGVFIRRSSLVNV